MIDTDKYEGHDTGWKAHFFEDGSIGIGGVCKLLTEETGHKTRKMIEANALLIQDAPLILKDYKRLLAENALLASQIRLAYEWVEAFHNEGTMISFIEHVYGDEEE